jgi:hypothetical protein
MKGELMILGIFLLPVGIFLIHHLLTRNKGIMTAQATVISKTPELAIGSGTFGNNNWNYKVVFEAGSLQIELYAIRQDYDQLEPGMTGTLTWQEENMLDFVPDTAQ